MSKQPNLPSDDGIIDPEEMFVTLELDDGSELECEILMIFELEEQDYIALTPVEEDEDEDEEGREVLFYRYFEDAEGEPSLENIEDDEEFDAVCDCFDQILDDEEFDEM